MLHKYHLYRFILSTPHINIDTWQPSNMMSIVFQCFFFLLNKVGLKGKRRAVSCQVGAFLAMLISVPVILCLGAELAAVLLQALALTGDSPLKMLFFAKRQRGDVFLGIGGPHEM